MSEISQGSVRIGIIGGGRGGSALIERFGDNVVFIVDINPSAPAFETARAKGIATFTSLKEIVTFPDLVFEATGSEKVLAETREFFGTRSRVVDHITVAMVQQVADANIREIADQIREVNDRLNECSARILTLSKDIAKSSVNLNMLGINASIEAGRAGEHGKGFSVVAGHMADSASEFKRNGQVIEELTLEIGEIGGKIGALLQKL